MDAATTITEDPNGTSALRRQNILSAAVVALGQGTGDRSEKDCNRLTVSFAGQLYWINERLEDGVLTPDECRATAEELDALLPEIAKTIADLRDRAKKAGLPV